eukprot:CAMPEP_0119123404 /NCGR_PEP_ID=MMETSP1310-20130426/3353_1 /TAXON_ID=464262 /ORGANISM="Genus nov. species nov., Strain RCC2339" /LENGTH=527 /DNA_ID=CAMNT_0007113205 /DNA_START=175 /DNA_END=1758 /DNA_ORIENTATION=+
MNKEKKGLFGKSSKKSKKAPNQNAVLISGPTGFRAGVHVDKDFTWAGDPQEAFDLQFTLGEGAYGKVYKAIMKQTGAELAIKSVSLSQQESESIQEEINVLKDCRHTNIVCYYGSAVPDPDSLWILMDFCEMGSVLDLCKTRPTKSLTEDQVGTVLGSVLKGLNYLHSKKIIHRDIKAGNILVNAAGEVKIADFGISSQIREGKQKAKTVIGTPLFMSPEVIEGKDYTYLADVWSLGITAIECAEGAPPRSDLTALRAMYVIVNEPAPSLKEHERWSGGFYNFVACCLQKNPTRRPPTAALLKDQFIEQSLARAKDIMAQLLQEYYAAVKTDSRRDKERDQFDMSALAMSDSRREAREQVETRAMMEEEEVEREEEVVGGRYVEPGTLARPIQRFDATDKRRTVEERSISSSYLTMERPEPAGASYREEEVEEVVLVGREERETRNYTTLEKRASPRATLEKPVGSDSRETLEVETPHQGGGEERPADFDPVVLQSMLNELTEWRQRTQQLEDSIRRYLAAVGGEYM